MMLLLHALVACRQQLMKPSRSLVGYGMLIWWVWCMTIGWCWTNPARASRSCIPLMVG